MKQHPLWRKVQVAAVLGLLVGIAVFFEARRQLLQQASPGEPTVGIMVSVRPLPAGNPVMLSDFTVKWAKLHSSAKDFYTDQQWQELTHSVLLCPLKKGEPLSRSCVGQKKAGARGIKKVRRAQTKKGILLWTEIGP